MRSPSFRIRTNTFRFGRFGRASLSLASVSALLVACAVAPADQNARSEGTGTSEAAILKGILQNTDGQITNGNGSCLDLPNGDTTNGNPLHIWDCNNGWNQTWYIEGSGKNSIIHYAPDPTKCVDLPAAAISNGVPTDWTQLQINDCNGGSGPTQSWQIDIQGHIKFAADTAKCMELRNGSAQNNTAVQVYPCNGTSGQTWFSVFGGGAQAFQLQNGDGLCLDEGTSPAVGSALFLAQCNTTGAHQTWCADGTAGSANDIFDCGTHLYVTSPNLLSMTQLVLSQAPSHATATTLSYSNHALMVGGQGCAGASTLLLSRGVVMSAGCNGSSLQRWFPRSVGASCRGGITLDGKCEPCGGNNNPGCVVGDACDPGLVSAYSPTASTICVSACGNVGQHACVTGGCTGGCYTRGTATTPAGPCTSNSNEPRQTLHGNDVASDTTSICRLNVTCGHNGAPGCNAGSYFEGADCYDGSTVVYSGVPPFGSWQCSLSNPPPPPPPVCGGHGVSSFAVCCGIETLTYAVCTQQDAILLGEQQTGLECTQGGCFGAE